MLTTLTTPMIRRLLRVDGTRRDFEQPLDPGRVRELIRADHVELITLGSLGKPPHVMVVDQLAFHKHLPINVEATRFYFANCRDIGKHKIRGDVVVVPIEEAKK